MIKFPSLFGRSTLCTESKYKNKILFVLFTSSHHFDPAYPHLPGHYRILSLLNRYSKILNLNLREDKEESNSNAKKRKREQV